MSPAFKPYLKISVTASPILLHVTWPPSVGHLCLCLHTGSHTQQAGLRLVCFKSSLGHSNVEHSYHIFSGDVSLKESLFPLQREHS